VKNRTTLAPANLKQLQFLFGTNEYLYLKKIDGKDTWIKGDFASKEDSPFLSLPQLNTRLKTAGLDTLTAMPAIQFNQSEDWKMVLNGAKIALNPLTNQAKILISKELSEKKNVEESAAGFVSYLDNFNLFVANTTEKGGAENNAVTTDGSKDIVYASSVHRDEFGITKGLFWSQSGKKLAFYRMDQSMVTDYPIIDWTQHPAKNENSKYPMAGGKSHQVTVGVYNTETKATIYLKTGEPAEQYLTNIAWSPDEKSIYIAVLNREQNYLKFNQYDAATGSFVKTLFEEKDDKYVEPLVPMLFLKNNPKQFIWQSNRDGWNHLYLYDISGKLVKQLTQGEWEVLDVKGFDPEGTAIFYSATRNSPISRDLYVTNIETGKTKRIVSEPNQVHVTQLSTDCTAILDNFSSPANPRTIQLLNIATGSTKTLLQAENPLAQYALGKLSLFTIKAKDGTLLQCRITRPINFDSTKTYPVIVYWYGGPHAQLITNGWNGGSGDYWFQYLAERGYVVFAMDTHGSDNRGRNFEQAIFRKVGDAQTADMLTAVDYLKTLKFVDTKRMGLFGWSFGGFNTTNFMLKQPDIFKAAVAGGPVMDWSYYEIMYTERYMDTPQENPEGYAATNLPLQADKLKGKLLLIHGLQDNVVVQQHSVNFVKAAVDKGVQVDYMLYPGHEHNVVGKDRAHLYQKVTDYFMENLK
jgi:dipeptidyl-peptidase 4